MSIAQYHLSEMAIPSGFQIYEERLEVVGIQHRRKEAIKFASDRNLSLEFEHDPGNANDHNAIKVIGLIRTHQNVTRHFIGYIPREISNPIMERGYYPKIIPRLIKTYVSDSGYVEVLFQILGPKGEFKSYKGMQSSISSTFRNVEQPSSISSERKISILLALGIFFMPQIFCWFLLRHGHSNLSRILGFSWMVIFTFATLAGA